MNKDFPDEWFQVINKQLNKMHSVVVDAKVETDIFDGITVLDRITSPSLYRYFVQDLPEERVLYLDCDIIVDGNIESFYFTDFQGNFVVAVEDTFLNLNAVQHSYPDFPNMKPYFCSGVLLINNELWKKYNLQDALCEYTFKYRNFTYLDQDVLNIVLKDKWLASDIIYHYQLHAGRIFAENGLYKELENFQNTIEEPKILHFTGPYKPWFGFRDNYNLKFREKYWFYYQLEWKDIIQKHMD